MKADDIVKSIARGAQNAFKTNTQFLGIEEETFNNANIRPEYIMTVKIGEALTDPSHIVSLETQFKHIRGYAQQIAIRREFGRRDKIDSIRSTLARYTFGKKDSQRLDILVRDANNDLPPLLMVEAKLGSSNISGIFEDVRRVARAIDMFDSIGLRDDSMYGAVVFHVFEEDKMDDDNVINNHALDSFKSTLNIIRAFLNNEIKHSFPWLRTRSDMLTVGAIKTNVTGYREYYGEDHFEDVFGKLGYYFIPGMILIGSSADIDTVSF